MDTLIYRSIEKHPEYKSELLHKVQMNSDWGFLHDWLLDRFAEIGSGILPQVYVVFDTQGAMVGYYVLCVQEVIHHDPSLKPWLGIILVFDEYRGRKYSPLIIEHACQTAKESGFEELYLVTEHENYYERFSFDFLHAARYLTGEPTKLYRRKL